jgi:hypothetical protein
VTWCKDSSQAAEKSAHFMPQIARETWDPSVICEDRVYTTWCGGTTYTGGKRDFQVGYAE